MEYRINNRDYKRYQQIDHDKQHNRYRSCAFLFHFLLPPFWNLLLRPLVIRIMITMIAIITTDKAPPNLHGS